MDMISEGTVASSSSVPVDENGMIIPALQVRAIESFLHDIPVQHRRLHRFERRTLKSGSTWNSLGLESPTR